MLFISLLAVCLTSGAGLRRGPDPFADPGRPGSPSWAAFATTSSSPSLSLSSSPTSSSPPSYPSGPSDAAPPPDAAEYALSARAERLTRRAKDAKRVLDTLIARAKRASDNSRRSVMQSRSLGRPPTDLESRALTSRLASAKATVAASVTQKQLTDGLLSELRATQRELRRAARRGTSSCGRVCARHLRGAVVCVCVCVCALCGYTGWRGGDSGGALALLIE